MHEHVREDLVEIKMAGHKEVKAQHIIKINTISRKSCHPTSCEEQNVDNETSRRMIYEKCRTEESG